jgi:hypothetical protein
MGYENDKQNGRVCPYVSPESQVIIVQPGRSRGSLKSTARKEPFMTLASELGGGRGLF